MRTIKFLSPSAVMQWQQDRQEFYLRRLSESMPPKIPQTRPMSVGSAFDAYIKADLHHRVFGTGGEFELDRLLEAQVEPHNLDWARVQGEYIFGRYKVSRAYGLLCLNLDAAGDSPRFEQTLEGTVSLGRDAVPVPLLGKPDLSWVTKDGELIIFDWKVNGYCSASATSPKPGFVMCEDLFTAPKQTRGNGKPHKDAILVGKCGVTINASDFLEKFNKDWALQLRLYGWILRPESRGVMIGAIDQLVGKSHTETFPLLRCAQHRAEISAPFSAELEQTVADIWTSIQAGHVFTDLPLDESMALCAQLDTAFEPGTDNFDQWYSRAMRI